jgi:hypothetical protein
MNIKKNDHDSFSIIYQGRSVAEVAEEYAAMLYGVTRSMGSTERFSLDDEATHQEIVKIRSRLESSLPKGLRSTRQYVIDPRYETMRDLARFVERKIYVKKIEEKIKGKKTGKIKDVLAETDRFSDENVIDEIVNDLKEKKDDEIKDILFQAFFGQSYALELVKCAKILQDINQRHFLGNELSINDEHILDKINNVIHRYVYEKNKEYHEKSLDQICREFGDLNSMDPSSVDAIKGRIRNVRIAIQDIQQGKALAVDKAERYPINLIAEICVKIENVFGDMLRDTQLLAILSMLDTSSPKGGLSQVETGEGKTYIILALAIIKNKQGKEVDVITSSATLAKRDVERFQGFYASQFGIFCSHNCDPNVGLLPNPCYQASSIVYGTTASFEGDSLRSEFYRADTFNGRSRGVAIVDEADSAMIDKATWLCQISDSVAGMSTVRPLLYFIWGIVIKKIEEVKDRVIETKEAYNAFLKEIKDCIIHDFEQFFSGGDQSFVIPDHLRAFTQYRISFWVDSALRSIFYTHDREYNACKLQKTITPIDYANTGEWEKDVQWEDALHQFLQMKNGMGVQTETLTKSFMSNYTLINKYDAFYGLSGTMGEKDEAETFEELYGVRSRKIPKFKTCDYKEKEAWICQSKQQWLDHLYGDVATDGLGDSPYANDRLPSSGTKRSRATLIICKTIADAKEVKDHFLKKGIKPSDIVLYTKGDEDKENIKEATAAKVIIATNLSGRGTDIEASSIEEAGGLHVIFSFLPSNRRIQDQGFGRTARKGLSGTGRLIIKHDDIKEQHLKKEEKLLLDVANNAVSSNFERIKAYPK